MSHAGSLGGGGSLSSLTFTTDSGTASPIASNIDILGGTGITTSASGNTVTIDASGASVPTGASGTVLQGAGIGVTPVYSTATYPSTATGTGTLLRADGTNWTVTTSTYPATNAINTLLYASSANVMSALATANNGTLVTSNTGAPSILAGPGTTGNILQSNAAAAPSFSTATYPSTAGTSGKVLISDGTNIVSSTPTYPNAASTALKHIRSDGTNFITTTVTYPDASVTAGKVIVSDGTNYIASTPTFPNASATTRKIIVSDGTNWVASTETYATPGTSGNILTSDGTNWTSAAPVGSYVLNMNQVGTFNPADATTYFVGVLATGWETAATTATTQLVVPKTGTVRQVYGRVTGTAGSSQSVTLNLRLNNTTDTLITNSSNWSTLPVTFNVTGLTLAVTAGDFLQLKITTPTWNPTNPTATFVSWSVYIA